MTLSAAYAHMLVDAHEMAVAIAPPDPLLTPAQGYDVQQLASHLRQAKGATAVGYKIGLTHVASQTAFGAAGPISGVLFDTLAVKNHSTIELCRFIAPMVELELAFVLHCELKGPDCTVPDVLNATAYISPAMEIIDNRFSHPANIANIIADNAGAAGFVLGDQKWRPDNFDTGHVSGRISCNGVSAGTGLSAAVLGHPARAVAWLANDLATRNRQLHAGDILLAGAFVGPLAVRNGDELTLAYASTCRITVAFA